MSAKSKKTPPPKVHGNHKKTTEAVIAMKKGGMRVIDIAAEVNTTPSNISHVLSRYNCKENQLIDYQVHRVPIYQALQNRIEKSISQIDIKKAGLYQKVLASRILLDKEQLIAGRATQNIALCGVVEIVEKEERARLMAAKLSDGSNKAAIP